MEVLGEKNPNNWKSRFTLKRAAAVYSDREICQVWDFISEMCSEALLRRPYWLCNSGCNKTMKEEFNKVELIGLDVRIPLWVLFNCPWDWVVK